MFILDTNVISELRKAKSGKADPKVVAWAAAINADELFLSAITILELEMGVLQVERRDSLQGNLLRSWLDNQVLTAFDGKILVVDAAVAQRCARLHVPNRSSERDALIAATALVHGMTIVTRNVTDFATSGVDLINPWH
jgi:predicted nucleic acid-binding protein